MSLSHRFIAMVHEICSPSPVSADVGIVLFVRASAQYRAQIAGLLRLTAEILQSQLSGHLWIVLLGLCTLWVTQLQHIILWLHTGTPCCLGNIKHRGHRSLDTTSLRPSATRTVTTAPTTTTPLYKLRPCPSYSRRRDRINLVPNFNSVPNVVQPHKTWVW